MCTRLIRLVWRLQAGLAEHALECNRPQVVEDVVAANKRFRAEHAEKIKARKAVEAENLARQAEARAAHQAKLEALAVENEGLMKQAQDDHQVCGCVGLGGPRQDGCEAGKGGALVASQQDLAPQLAACNRACGPDPHPFPTQPAGAV